MFLNGLPIALIELKDPTDTQANLGVAIDQLDRYMQIAPDLFVSNLVLVVSDGMLTRVGSITSGHGRFMPWRPLDDREGGHAPTLEALIRGLFDPRTLVDYLRTCVTFEEDERGEIDKRIAGYHQFRAVRKARASVLARLKPPSGTGDGRGGVIWHTQGSGKSLTMLMLAGALIRESRMANPTIVMITDRNDLDDQLFDTFAAGRALLRQDPVRAANREHLRALLDRAAGGVVFTTIQKFAEAHGVISERSNVVVMADEAHRSQYGFVEGGARWMREALPNATFVGFTGTPLERDDRNTIHVFGDYADVYDIRRAVEDSATRPLYYESRIIKLKVDEEGMRVAEEEVEYVANPDRGGEGKEGRFRVPPESLVGAQERIERVAAFIVEHWEKRRAAMEGKAMAVTMSRDIAARLYEAIRILRPDWHDADDERGVMKVVVTGTNEEPVPLRNHVRTKAARKRLAERFKAPHDDLRLVIVLPARDGNDSQTTGRRYRRRRRSRTAARHRRRRAPGDRRRGRCQRCDRPVRRRGAVGRLPRHPWRRVPRSGGGSGAEELGPGDAAQAAQRPDSYHGAHEHRPEPQVPRGARRRDAALYEPGDHHRRDDLAADRLGEEPSRRAAARR